MDDKLFDTLTLDERIDVVAEKMGGMHPDRISTVPELMALRGETVYLVISPYGQEQDLGNGFIYEWVVGDITTPDRTPIDTFDGTMVDDVKLICEYLDDDPDADYRAISLKDFNVIPNNHNNHCVFSSKDGIEAYIVFRKLKYDEDVNLTEIKDEYDYWVRDEQIQQQ